MKNIKVESKEINGETWFKFNSKYDEVRYYWGNRIIIACIIVLIVLGSSTGYLVMKNAENLKANPFIYGAEKMRDVECQCSQMVSGERVAFFFNDTDFWTLKETRKIDFSIPNEDWDKLIPES